MNNGNLLSHIYIYTGIGNKSHTASDKLDKELAKAVSENWKTF